MKRFLCILMAFVIACAPITAYATSDVPSNELTQGGKIIAFNPKITSVKKQKSSMVVNIDTVSCAFLYEVQWSNRSDFSKCETKFFRNVDNHGCMAIDNKTTKEDGKTYNVRVIWYGGYRISFRKVLRKNPKEKLITTQGIVNMLRKRYAIQKRLYVNGLGKYVRVRCVYYGVDGYAYSKWTKPVAVK